MDWIKCSDKLPEDDERFTNKKAIDVLVTTQYKRVRKVQRILRYMVLVQKSSFANCLDAITRTVQGGSIMKCAYCEYSVPVKNSPCFNCTYSGDNSKLTDKCDEAFREDSEI